MVLALMSVTVFITVLTFSTQWNITKDILNQVGSGLGIYQRNEWTLQCITQAESYGWNFVCYDLLWGDFTLSFINIFRSLEKLLSEIKVPIPQSTVIIIDVLRYLDKRIDVKRLLREMLFLAEGKMKLQI